MSKEYVVNHLDIAAFTKAGQQLQGQTALTSFERLQQELPAGADAAAVTVTWQATGEFVAQTGGAGHNWLHLQVQAKMPLTCQRCLQPVDVDVQVQRDFRFVKDEATAEAQDDECEEDLLVMSRSFDLHTLIEDELLMALPLVPRHEQCPQPLDFDEAVQAPEQEGAEAVHKPNPFAVLAQLRAKADPESGA